MLRHDREAPGRSQTVSLLIAAQPSGTSTTPVLPDCAVSPGRGTATPAARETPRKYTSPCTCLTSGSRNSENTWPCNTGVGMELVIVRIVYVFQSQVLGVTRYSGVEDLAPTLPTGKSQIQNDKSFIIG